MNDANTCTVVFADKTRCTRAVRARGWCNPCYQWSRKNGHSDPNGRYPFGRTNKGKTCSVTFSGGSQCKRPADSFGWCEACYVWSRSNGKADPQGRHQGQQKGRRVTNPCDVCGQLTRSGTLCPRHYERKRVHGDPAASLYAPHDVFYVVANSTDVKFGVTAGAPDRRLAELAKGRGLTEQLRVIKGMPDGAVLWLERQCRSVLADEGASPTVGKEQFDAGWTWLILSIVDRFS